MKLTIVFLLIELLFDLLLNIMHIFDHLDLHKTQVMQERCEGMNSCAVNATNSLFGDPCGGIAKYLTSTWDCNSPG